MTIGISIVAGLVLIIGVHLWLHRVVKFKMDESAILKFMRESGDGSRSLSTQVIATSTDIAVERVRAVCAKSQSIQREANEGWVIRLEGS